MLKIPLWSKQKDILASVFTHRKTVVRSCHSAGKTFTAAIAVLAFLYLKSPCKIITTAPTWYQVKDLLWSEINYWFKTRLASMGFPGIPLTTRLNVNDNWFATGISPKDSVNFQGFHQEHVLVVFDEAPGVRYDIVQGAESLLASGDAHMLWIGNPTESSGHFYEAFRDPNWTKIQISAFETPNFTGEPIPQETAQKLISPEWVEEKRQEWGEDSPLYVSRVLGDFPQEGESQLIPLSLVEAAVRREVRPEGEKVMGLDIARFGDDLTVYCVRQGDVMLSLDSDAKRDTMAVAGRAKQMVEAEGISQICADVIGIGSGVVDRLTEQNINVLGVNSGAKAREPNKYFNRRTEMWFVARDWLKTGKIPNDDRLIRDLTVPRFTYTSKGQYQLESKEETKKRLGRSPDFGDALVLSLCRGAKVEDYLIFL